LAVQAHNLDRTGDVDRRRLALVYPTLAADIVGLGLFAVVVAAQLIRIRAAREPVRAR